MTAPADRMYRATTAFFAELAGQGVEHVVISPGSRSTPLAVPAHHTPGLRSWVHIDERSAGFFALGLARSSGRPAALICSSGTAAANYLPAVIEAHYANIGLIVCTADRPPELREWGPGQTVDQVHLYGTHTRWFADLPIAADVAEPFWTRLAARAVQQATGFRPGPVHLNWPFREPLVPVDWKPPEAAEAAASPSVSLAGARGASPDAVARLIELSAYERGLIVAGPNDDPRAATAVLAFAAKVGWPIIAEPLSQARSAPGAADAAVVASIEHLARCDEFMAAHRPDVVVRFGLTPTNKPLRLALEAAPPQHHVLIDPGVSFAEPSAIVTDVLVANPAELFAAAIDEVANRSSGWCRAWVGAERVAQRAIAAIVDEQPLLEPGIVRAIARVLPAEATLYVSNSMPVRDVDAFWPVADLDRRIYGHRGASGIDGLHSGALGVAAATGRPVVLLAGDVAFLHDIGGFLAANRFGLDLTVVVPDNGGGGIFAYLPQATIGPSMAFDTLFTTPPAFDFAAVGALPGVTYHEVHTAEALEHAVARGVGAGGVHVVRVPVDQAANIEQHRELARAVQAAVASAPR